VTTFWAVGSALIALIAVLSVLLAVVPGGDPPSWTEESVLVNGVRETDGEPVTLDSTFYLPSRTPAPAVLLAHGYGASKAGVVGQARMLARRGYVVLTWSARGFGGSGGLVHLDSPDYEVKDAQLMLDELARRPEVSQDAKGDPHVGVVGASYGGALALMLAGTDRRVDALVPSITWNDLRQALFPQFITRPGQVTAAGVQPIAGAGVFKRQWTALLLGASAAAGAGAVPGADADAETEAGGGSAGTPAASPVLPPSPDDGGSPQALDFATLRLACGRIATDLCLGYLQAATTGRPDQKLLKLLAAASPARVANKITAPTLLIQGQTDSLFPLSEADANARAIASAGTDVQVIWTAGGHDGGIDESDRLETITADFLDRTLGHSSADTPVADVPTPGFRVTVPDAVVSSIDTNPAPQLRAADAFPGLPQAGSVEPLRLQKLRLTGRRQLAISPPGAVPASLTSLPGASVALGLLGTASSATSGGAGPRSGPRSGSGSGLSLGVLPGQHAAFETAPLSTGMSITGSSQVTVRISATSADATLFASLLDVGPDGGTTLPQQLVSAIRLDRLSASGQVVTIALPAIVRDVPAGHRLRVVLSSTDQSYAVPVTARGYQISLAGDSALSVPVIPLTVDRGDSSRTLLIVAVLLGLAILAVVLAFSLRNRWVRRRTVVDVDPDLVDVPLYIANLGKAYGDGFRAVSDVTFRVEAGQVLGLLGPNGAGKTTTLRMLMGLILPTEGEIRIFGHRVTPGAAVLSRLGSFIEGPGFLPHLSGAENLELYWRSTGRRGADSGMAIALEIAGLGDDVQRKVRTYSQGMRQRLAIAQAMLGLPDLLVLDEPTNGLDPPQIREMRAVLGRYAATGRTVVVSSHLLTEVEQTCSHVVVMAGGRLIAEGPVDELIGAATSMLVDVDDPALAGQIAASVRNVDEVRLTPTGLLVRADPIARRELIRRLVLADVRVDRVAPQRGLEQTFLALIGEAD
jgi:ABC-2 type transport system ATP-binding protein